MKKTGRALLILVLELGLFLFVLHFVESPLGADMPASAATIILVVGWIAIPVLIVQSRWPGARAIVVGCVGTLLMLSGIVALAMSSPHPGWDVGTFCFGAFILVSEPPWRRGLRT